MRITVDIESILAIDVERQLESLEGLKRMNNHYISRLLTRPWEFHKRKLYYYDFVSDRFGIKSSRSLFSMENLLAAEDDQLINEMIEAPFSSWRQRFSFGGDSAPTSEDEESSILIISAIQAARYEASRSSIDKQELRNFIQKTIEYKNHLRDHLKRESLSLTLRTNDDLFFPESGLFGIRTFIDGPQYMIGIALHPEILLLQIFSAGGFAREAVAGWLCDYSHEILSIAQRASVSVAEHCSKIVIPPRLRTCWSEAQLRDFIINARCTNRQELESFIGG